MDLPTTGFFGTDSSGSQQQVTGKSTTESTKGQSASSMDTDSYGHTSLIWTHIPDMDTGTSTSEDHLFAGPKLQPAGKVAVCMSNDEWLCDKLGKLNFTLVEGYPSHSSETGGLLKDQFI